MDRDNAIQVLARGYMSRLTALADSIGIGAWLNATKEANEKGKCKATQEQVDILSRICDEERIGRHEIPHLIGMSYRQAYEKDLFSTEIRKLKHVGVYSRNDALVLAMCNNDKEGKEDC